MSFRGEGEKSSLNQFNEQILLNGETILYAIKMYWTDFAKKHCVAFRSKQKRDANDRAVWHMRGRERWRECGRACRCLCVGGARIDRVT